MLQNYQTSSDESAEMSLLESSFTQMQKGLKSQHQKLVRVLRAIPKDVLDKHALLAVASTKDNQASTNGIKKKTGKSVNNVSSNASSKGKPVASTRSSSTVKPPSPKGIFSCCSLRNDQPISLTDRQSTIN